MQQIWDGHGNTAVTFFSGDMFPQTGDRVVGTVHSLSGKPLIVGVVTPIRLNLDIVNLFEFHSLDDNGILRLWSRGFVQLGRRRKVLIWTILPGSRRMAGYSPVEPDEIIVADISLNEVNLRTFVSVIKYHEHTSLKMNRR